MMPEAHTSTPVASPTAAPASAAHDASRPHPESIISLRGVHKSFGPQVVLDGMDLDIEIGKTTVILGPSGCGKSVMLKHIVGLLGPDAGEVWFDGVRIDTLRERDLGPIRLQIGLVFQMSALFDSMDIEENIAFPLREHTKMSISERRERVRDALRLVDLDGVERKLPSQLSGGQRKRVALARAIVIRPRVILYDEPTTGLDPIRADGINELILRLNAELGVTSVVVTHDLVSAAKVSDRVVMLHKGKVAASGTYESLTQSHDPWVRQFLAGQYIADEQ
ncbi:MAG: ABC transporter ATP-binding protein [Planctomycetota bacterium]|nr:ABC transporter ATP-binding protein [Planctomycetota bacterium]